MELLAFIPAIVAAVLFATILLIWKRYKRCPSDKILVVYGKVGSGKDGAHSAKCIHGGAAFVWPVIQDYQFLDLTPSSIDVNLTKALSRQNIRVDVPSRFTIGISTDPTVMTNAAERLLGLQTEHIQDLARDIIIGQLRLVIATMDIEEINSDRDKFLANIQNNVESELKKIGLKLINVNITDIRDESGYIEALGKEAAAQAINEARVSVAEKVRDGSIGEADAQKDERVRVSQANAFAKAGEADAHKEERIKVAGANAEAKVGEADANKSERIKVAEANAEAVEGENLSKVKIAESEAKLREKEAEALRIAIAAEKVQKAKALQEAYQAEKEAEEARAELEKAKQLADIIVKAEIAKKKAELDAEAEAERIRREAKGNADAILYKMTAEAEGHLEILNKQAEGFNNMIQAAGGDAKEAVLMIIAEKLPELVKMQVEAIKNIKIDKVTVWDNGGNGANGEMPATANFLSGMYKSIPPLEELFKMAGMELPNYLGKSMENGNGNGQHSNGEEKTSEPAITDAEEVK